MKQIDLAFDLSNEFQARAATRTAIEEDAFPFEYLSDIAEHESWRKEVYRPVYHVHKWWAQRLGSVFRSIIIGALSPAGTDIMRQFYSPVRFPDSTVFDPFMGSGTTPGEALKLGCKAIGRDINPVAYFAVRNALEGHPPGEAERAFKHLSETVKPKIEYYYRCKLPNGEDATALYYFWVKVLPCPSCKHEVDLFSSYIFSRHAYPSRYPLSKAVCPCCGEINEVRFDATSAECRGCHRSFDPSKGPARGTKAVCPACLNEFRIAAAARSQGQPPGHRLYAKMALTRSGEKVYLPADDFDHRLVEEASARLRSEPGLYPVVEIEPGYNTDQALGYGYRFWHEMFNERQLLCLGLLAREISQFSETSARDAMACLFSGTLEFNNMFASFKGEGTGAVRHMFSHHILKPERMPLEANPWGTPKSSGSFSTLFKSRLMRAQEYCANPFEIELRHGKAEKVYGLSDPIGHEAAADYAEFVDGRRLYLSCGDSSRTDIPDRSVDAIITDPPFFDNVNYSQLADFFHVWQRHVFGSNGYSSTRSDREVQHQEPDTFQARLSDVFRECCRILKDDGLLAFSYHHSRSEGWQSVLGAVMGAGFRIVAAQPIKAEMSVAQPKAQAKEPIDLDIILVCRKREVTDAEEATSDLWPRAVNSASAQVERFSRAGRRLSRNDVRIILTAQLIRRLSDDDDIDAAVAHLDEYRAELEQEIERLHALARSQSPS